MDWLQTIVLWGVPVVLAITLHEAAHGFVARQFGDRTAEMLGRVTLNPLKHVDPVGTVLVPALLVLLNTGFVFGWAKPVPVNAGNLRHPKRDMIWVAAAGPGSNFLQGLLWAGVMVAIASSEGGRDSGLAEMARNGVVVNLVLMALNLLPIPPLDGGRVLAGVLPDRAAGVLSRIEPYGLFIVIALLYFNVLDLLMRPLIVGALGLIGTLLGAAASS